MIRTGIFPTYSPDGERLACNSEPGAVLRDNSLLVMKADGTNRLVLFKDAEKNPIAPAWSPQSDRIAFGLGRFFPEIGRPGSGGHRVMDAERQEHEDAGPTAGELRVSRAGHTDGREIVCRVSDGKTSGLIILNADTETRGNSRPVRPR